MFSGVTLPRRLWGGLWRFLGALVQDIRFHGTFGEAAQIAYWAVLALFPFLMFLLTIVGFLPLAGLDAELTQTLYQTLPREAARLLDETVHEVLGRQRRGLLVVTLLGALWTASSGVGALMRGLNRAFGVRETRPYWKVKSLAFFATLVIALLVLVALVALLVGPGVGHRVFQWLGIEGFFIGFWRYGRFGVALVALTMGVSRIYFVLPNVQRRYHPLTVGSIVATTLWVLSSLLFDRYLRSFGSFSRTYGTLGAAVVLLTSLYWGGLIFLLGGEVDATRVRLRRRHTDKGMNRLVQPQPKDLPKS